MSAALANRTGDALERWGERLEYLGNSALQHQPRRVLSDLEQEIDWKSESLAGTMRGALGDTEDTLVDLGHRLALCHPTRKMDGASATFDALASRLGAASESAMHLYSERAATAAVALKALGPEAVLSRGYSVTLDAAGNILTDPDAVASGDKLVTKLAGGDLKSTAE